VSEVVIARVVTAYLRELGWACYFEVALGGHRADIVARQGPLTWVVETKTAFSLAVLEQAEGWTGFANYVSVAVPHTRNRFGLRVARHFGIGVLFVGEKVTEQVGPVLRRQISEVLRKSLAPEHQTWCEPGTQGGHYSPFAATVRAVHDALRGRPEGMTMREIVDSIEHHYNSDSTARSTLPRWIRAGHIRNVREDDATRPARWFYEATRA
jgi:hypothetical protein